MNGESRFDWYEKVRVVSARPEIASINGALGAILGKTETDDGRWLYGVHIYAERVVWSCLEDELQKTGDYDRRETFYDGETARVSKSGELLDCCMVAQRPTH